METISAFFFSGTGNTEYVINYLAAQLGDSFDVRLYNVEKCRNMTSEIVIANKIIIAFPIYGSAPPIPIRQFVNKYADCFKGKQLILIATEYMFSGDGAESLGRWIRQHGGRTDFEEHILMPNNLSDFGLFKIRNGSEIAKILKRADKRIDNLATAIKNDEPFCRGRNIFSHALGYFSQRFFWLRHEEEKFSRLRVDRKRCCGCGLCVNRCPVDNLKIIHGKANVKNHCVLCYRCVNLCPRQALTLLGRVRPQQQYSGPFIINTKTRK